MPLLAVVIVPKEVPKRYGFRSDEERQVSNGNGEL